MNIRWKLMIVLLTISLIPLSAVTLLYNRLTLRVGEELGERARDKLITQAEDQLRTFVNTQAAEIGRHGTIIQLILQLQAREVERWLASEPTDQEKVYWSEHYDDPATAPELGTVPRHLITQGDGHSVLLPISLDQQVFKLATGVDPGKVVDDVSRLARMTPFYRAMHLEYPDMIYWQYTSLENGVHSCYPGHGGYPPDYDPRKRDWYLTAKQLGRLYWAPPYVEVSTRHHVMSASMPVYRPDGSFAGATAIDVRITDILERGKIPTLPSSTAMMVVLLKREGFDYHEEARWAVDFDKTRPEDLGLFILAKPTDATTSADYELPFTPEWLESDHPHESLEVIREMAAGHTGVRQVMDQGQRCLWAYGHTWEPNGFLVVSVPYDEVVEEANQVQQRVRTMTRIIMTIMLSLLGIMGLVVVMVALIASQRVTRPVHRLAEAAERIAHGDFGAHVNIQGQDELAQLGQTFNAMIPQLQDRLKMRQALDLAMEVQQHLLPNEPPKIKGLDIAGRSIYCDETGGDYYDFLDLSKLNPHTLGIAVGDVTGHGIAAALLMTGARALLRAHASEPGSISDLMRQINEHLTEDTPAGRFMTLFYMILDTRKMSLHWSSAGHDPAILYHSGQDQFEELGNGGIPLGIEADWRYTEHTHDRLEPGAVIVIGTDGIWEQNDPQGQPFGKAALRNLIQTNAEGSAENISRAITGALAAHRKDRPQDDDVTLVVIKVL
ncbi:MAG: SpoIIE family protein phosphatase [Phycisphaerales bacterium]|nr:SpoIIE family protein phosphatase [Phycisphaerales bacterium]